ncbi:serine/threonine-protein kinase [Streptomyces sp. E5N298]|uniref:serine/threonine-protein kinase n=1 Tax=Streptomyces sp. E5N298 TaxID=1851983 RepID=UPI001EE7A543|nr:serine/threonine-protein kinase [Streptomyces sp. E5N298]
MEDLRPEDPRRIGAYRLLRRLGGGGMGQVFLGRSRGGRAVAVKVVRPDLADQREFRRRFGREVEAARRVGGFYTAHVLDADPEADPPWLATAYIPGPSLQQAITDQGPLPETSLGQLAAGLAEGLAAVHACGMVHRDLKPGNVLLAEDGPRLIDFGIARAADDTLLTGTGEVIGTPGFMAPEYLMGDRAGPPSDVFALGAVLAYAATGRPPFGGGAAQAVNYRAVHEEPDLSQLPAAYARLVADCLAKDAARRPGVEEIIDRVPAWDADAPTWLPPRVATMIDEARPPDSAGTAVAFFSGPDIPVPRGWSDAGIRAREQARAEAESARARRRLSRLLRAAETVGRGITDPGTRSRALARVAAATAPVDAEHGRSLARLALRSAAEASEGLDRIRALADVAKTLAATDEHHAREAAEGGLALANGVRGLFRGAERREALAAAAPGLAAVDPARAESVATTVGEGETLAEVAEVMAVRDPGRAERIAGGLEPDQADDVWRAVARAMAPKDPRRAERVARRLTGRWADLDRYVLNDIAQALAATDPEDAVRIACEGVVVHPDTLARTVVEAAASAGPARAERLVRAIPDASLRDSALQVLIEETAVADPDRAEQLARDIADEEERAEALADAFYALLHTDFPRAQRAARGIPPGQPCARVFVLATMAESLASYDPGCAERLLHEAETIAVGLDNPDEHAGAMTQLVGVRARADLDRAVHLARLARQPAQRVEILSAVAASLAAVMPDRAKALVAEAERAARDLPDAGAGHILTYDLARRLADFAPEVVPQVAADAVRVEREADGNRGDRYNVHAMDALVCLAEVDPRRAADLTVEHGRLDKSPADALADLVEALAGESGWELKRLETP